MGYRNLIRGEIGIINKIPFRLDLQTCLGTVVYGKNIVGAAHGLIPSEIGSNYGYPLMIVPKGIKELALLIKSQKKDKNLGALLFGGKIDSSKIGMKNAEQARKVLEELKIPIKIDFTPNTYWDTNLLVYPDRFEVKSQDSSSIFSKKFSEIK